MDIESIKMSKEVFVGIIKAIQDQRKREEKFCDAISQAFVDAGDLAEFHQPSNFTPPTNILIDSILESIAKAFVSEHQTYENAIDLINYFMYELDTMEYVFMEPSNPENPFEVAPVPAWVALSDGKKAQLSTPEELYDALVYEMVLPHKQEKEYHQPNEQDMIHSVMPENTQICDLIWDDEQLVLWNKIKPLIEDKLGVEGIHPMNTLEELGADSLDGVELMMLIEHEFNISITDLEMESFTLCSHCKDLVPLIESKLA